MASRWLIVASAFLAVAVFLLDVGTTPLGIAGGVLYVTFILLSLWLPQRKFVLLFALVATILTLLGYLVSPPSSAPWIAFSSRLFFLFAIWVTAFFCIHFGDSARHDEQMRLRAILYSAVEAIITIDEHGIVESANPAVERIFQYAPEELIGHNVSMLMPEPDRSNHDQYLADYLRTGEKTIIGIGREVKGKKKDGTIFPLGLSVSELNLRTQHLYTGVIRDLTKQKEAEERATSFGHIVENSLNEIYVFDADSLKFIHVNRGARENLGYSMKELECLTPLDLKPAYTQEMFETKVQPLRTGKREVVQFTTDHRRKNGSIYPVEVHLQYGQFGHVNAFTAINLDISKRRDAEKAVVAATEETRKSIGQELHDVVAQEITSISILAKVLENENPGNNKKFQSDVANIQKVAQSALRNIKDISSGLYPLSLEVGGLNKALNDLAARRRAVFGISCTYTGEPFEEEKLSADTKLHLYRIAQEAVNNANQHARAENISIRLKSRDNGVALFVEDDGLGISHRQGAEQRAGFYSMRHRADLIGARLDVLSNNEGGTTVSCAL